MPSSRFGDPLEQRSHSRRGGGDAGRHGEAARRQALPALLHRLQQPVAPFREVDPLLVGKDGRPSVEDRAEPVERNLPMSRDVAGVVGGAAQLVGVDSLDQQRIERARKVSGEPKRFRRPSSSIRFDQLGERKQAGERIDRRRDRFARIRRVERAADPLLEFRVADRRSTAAGPARRRWRERTLRSPS